MGYSTFEWVAIGLFIISTPITIWAMLDWWKDNKKNNNNHVAN